MKTLFNARYPASMETRLHGEQRGYTLEHILTRLYPTGAFIKPVDIGGTEHYIIARIKSGKVEFLDIAYNIQAPQQEES